MGKFAVEVVKAEFGAYSFIRVYEKLKRNRDILTRCAPQCEQTTSVPLPPSGKHTLLVFVVVLTTAGE